jgi:cytochrome c
VSLDGRLVLKADDDLLITIQPVDFTKTDDFEPWVRGKFLATQCQGCHTFDRNGASGIGPNLYKVAGRPIGSLNDFEYSPALKSVGGRWTNSALLEFLKDPESFAPGTEMRMNASFTDGQLSDLAAYLDSLQ